ncbi:MAG: chromosome segregation protein SMC [Cyclobacteriaceae bacterium]
MDNKPENIDKGSSPSRITNDVKPVTTVKDPKSNIGLVVGLAVVLLIAAAAGIYFYINSQNLAEEKAATELQLQQAYYDLDSIGSQLDQKILTIRKLGGDVDSLVSVKAQLEDEKAQLRRREINQTKQIKALKDRVGGYKELLVAKDEEIKKLQDMNVVLVAENTELKEVRNQLNATVDNLNNEKTQLLEQVQVASQLKIEDFAVYAINKRGKEYKNEFRNRQIEQLKIQFALAENKVAPIEGKDIILRVLGIDDNVLFDVARGSGTFTIDGREDFFTARQEVLYDRNKKQVTFLYDKGSDYDKGVYTVELYTDEYMLGKGTFTVK